MLRYLEDNHTVLSNISHLLPKFESHHPEIWLLAREENALRMRNHVANLLSITVTEYQAWPVL